MEPFLNVEQVSKYFVGHTALDKVSISVPKQSVFGLLGPNGAGKTTLIRIINQITAPDSGSVFIQSQQLHKRHIERIGYLPEERGLYKKMKVGEQAIYLARLKGLSRNDAIKKLKIWFEKFDLEKWWNRKIEELSKGMQQKVQFIVTILHNPSVLIFDEPFSGFDPINANLLKEEILRLRNNGATIIFSTHNMASVEEICDEIALINRSKKILEGKVADIKEKYKPNIFQIHIKNLKEKPEVLSKNNHFDLMEHRSENNDHFFKIKLHQTNDPNILVRQLIEIGELHSFQEIMPSMNEVFIKRVNEDKAQLMN